MIKQKKTIEILTSEKLELDKVWNFLLLKDSTSPFEFGVDQPLP